MTKKRNITLTEFFCGGGGLGLGFKQAGVDILKAYDFDRFAIESYKHNVSEHGELKSVTDLKGEDIPKSDVWTFGFPCFPAGTLILCKDGLKNIEDIKEGDYVLTHNNRWKKVLNTMSKFAPTIKLSSETLDVITTNEHPFYALENENEVIKWIAAKDMKDKYWSTPTKFNSLDIPKMYINNESLNNKFYWFLGYLLTNGVYNDDILSFETINKDVVENILKELNIGFETTALVISDIFKCYEITLKDKELIDWLLKEFTNFSLPIWLLNVDNKYKLALFDGIIYNFTKKEDSCIIFDTYNKNNAYVLKFLLKSIGYNVSIKHFKIPYEKETFSNVWSMIIHTDEYDSLRKDDKIFEKVYDVIDLNEKVMVYNLEVEDDNSYVADSIVVHNCQDISIAGKQAGMVKGKTRSGLFYEIMRLLEETKEENKPKIILAENVKQVKNYFEEIEKEFNMQDYTFTYVLYNSKYFNVAQNRERYFMLGVHKSISEEFTFKENPVNNPVPPLSSFLEDEVPEKFYLDIEKAKLIIEDCLKKTKDISGTHACLTPHRIIMRQNGRRMKEDEEPMFTLTATEVHGVIERKIQALGLLNMLGNNSVRRVYHTNGISPTLTTAQGGNTQVKIIEGKDEEIPLDKLDSIDEIIKYFTLRRLTPREYARLQGFPDSYEQIVSNSQFYKQMGNAVTVKVAKNIAEQIIEFLQNVERKNNK